MSLNSYKISDKVLKDIESIWLYTYENWSLGQADRYYELIIAEIEFIADNFLNGKSMEHIRKGYRVSKVKSHLIFYRENNDKTVEVIRILHQMMDVVNRLIED